jgi:hypothetical protein
VVPEADSTRKNSCNLPFVPLSWDGLPRDDFQARPELARRAAPITCSTNLDGEYWLAGERRLIERDEWSAPRLRVDQTRAKSKTLGDFATRGW